MDHFYPPDNARLILILVANRHVVGDFRHALFRQPAGLQNIGVRQIKLLAAYILPVRCDAENAGLIAIQQGGKDRRAVQIRPAKIIERAIVGD